MNRYPTFRFKIDSPTSWHDVLLVARELGRLVHGNDIDIEGMNAQLEIALTPTDEKGLRLLEQFSQELDLMLAPWEAQIE